MDKDDQRRIVERNSFRSYQVDFSPHASNYNDPIPGVNFFRYLQLTALQQLFAETAGLGAAWEDEGDDKNQQVLDLYPRTSYFGISSTRKKHMSTLPRCR